MDVLLILPAPMRANEARFSEKVANFPFGGPPAPVAGNEHATTCVSGSGGNAREREHFRKGKNEGDGDGNDIGECDGYEVEG